VAKGAGLIRQYAQLRSRWDREAWLAKAERAVSLCTRDEEERLLAMIRLTQYALGQGSPYPDNKEGGDHGTKGGGSR